MNFLAIDLGAESGRSILGSLSAKKLELKETHRFPNSPVWLTDAAGQPTLYWNILGLWQAVKEGISRSIHASETPISGVGIDTWGVDFGLLDRQGNLVANPVHYRDSRTDGMMEEAFKRMPREEIFKHTGNQFLQLNTLYQLESLVEQHSPWLDMAENLLTLPNLLNYWLTGQTACEFTHATTTQCFDPTLGDWSDVVLQAMGIPRKLFPKVIQPGTLLGSMLPVVDKEVGGNMPVIATASHDTGSAVAAVPATEDGFAWISSGTWSIMGTELDHPVINSLSLENNFTNEGGASHTYRFSKNIMGLWLLQECRRTWAAEGSELNYAEITAMAQAAPAFRMILDVDYGEFLKPGNMPGRIREYCKLTGQEFIEDKGVLARSILESLALKYRNVLDHLEEMTGHRLNPLYIVGGGTQNHLLSQFAADATGRQVITGPVEATAAGNILVQAVGLGELSSLQEARQVVRNSFEVHVFEPNPHSGWDKAYAKLLSLM